MKDIIEYYKVPGKITNIEKYKDILTKITDNPEFLCTLVQGLLLQDNIFAFYKTPFKKELQIHPVYIEELLDEIINIDSEFLTTPRIPQKRIITSCREFATLTCSLLRAKGISARCRCGFPLYINIDDGYLADHWTIEYWDGTKWVRVDPQIDAMQLSANQRKEMIDVGIFDGAERQYSFSNPHNLTDQDFIIAGSAWLYVRRGAIPAERFRYIHSNGLTYIRGELLRDFNALNKVEIQTHNVVTNQGYSWDSWRLLSASDNELSKEDYALLDHIAELTLNVDKNFTEIQSMYENCIDLQVPKDILNNKRRTADEVPKQAWLDLMEEESSPYLNSK